VTTCDTTDGTAGNVNTTLLTFDQAAHGLSAGEMAVFKFNRDADSSGPGTDTMAADARLIDNRVEWS